MISTKEAQNKALELAGIERPEEIFKPQGQVNFYIKEQPIFYDENELWWIWDKEHLRWKISNEIDILNHIESITGEDIITPKNRVLILNSLKQECRKNKPKEINPSWIQFKDKIVDITTGNIFPASPDYFVTNPIPYSLHPENFELTPNIDRIFEQWVGKEYVQTLHEIIAYTLIPDYPIHRLFCLIGSGMNGKSCFLKMLKKFVGRENVTTTELDRLTNSRFEVTRLHKKLVCLMGETNFTEMKQTAIIKSLTGQDEIPYEYKRKTPFSDVNYAKLIIATNNLPSTTDKTIGWYRRWCIIDFPNTFSEKKDILSEIPEEEYESLALRCTFILRNLIVNKEFHNEGSIEERMKKYEEKSNPIDKFLKEFTIEGSMSDCIQKWEFEKRLNEWLTENRFRSMGDKSIVKHMKDKGIEQDRMYVDWYNEGNLTKKRLRCWVGIRWKDK